MIGSRVIIQNSGGLIVSLRVEWYADDLIEHCRVG